MKSPFLIFRSTKHQGDFLSSTDPSMISWIHFTLFVRISLFSYRETETDLINRISIMTRGSLRKSYMQPMQPTPYNPQFFCWAGNLACKVVMFIVILFIGVMLYMLPGTVEYHCNMVIIQTNHGRSACYDVCKMHLCCFATNENMCAKKQHM